MSNSQLRMAIISTLSLQLKLVLEKKKKRSDTRLKMAVIPMW